MGFMSTNFNIVDKNACNLDKKELANINYGTQVVQSVGFQSENW